MSFLYQIPFGGDFTMFTGPDYQVESIQSYTDSITGETATRTLTREFRQNTTGQPFTGGYTLLTIANLAALVLDADDPLYFELRYTRAGADATGTIDVFGVTMDWIIDKTATSHHGMITNQSFIGDVKELIKSYVEFCIVQQNGANMFEVKYQHPDTCEPKGKPIMYIYSLDFANVEIPDNCDFVRDFGFRIGIKRSCKSRVKESDFDKQFSITTEAFNSTNYFKNDLINFTFKTINYANTSLWNLGISEVNTLASASRSWIHGRDQYEGYEIGVNFKLEFKNTAFTVVL